MSEHIYCPECGTQNEAGALFCENCGTPMEAEPEEAVTAEEEAKTAAEEKETATEYEKPEPAEAVGNVRTHAAATPKKKSARIPVIIIVLLALAGAGVFAYFHFLNKTEVDLTKDFDSDILDIQGYDGKGHIKGINEDMVRERWGYESAKDNVQKFLDTVEITIDKEKDGELSNGDTVRIVVKYKKSDAEKNSIKVVGEEKTVRVSGLQKAKPKDTNVMKNVTADEYEQLVKGELSKEQFNNVLSAVMEAWSYAGGTDETISEQAINGAGLREKSDYSYLLIHGTAFGLGGREGISSIEIETANRILSSFTTCRYEKNRLYKTNDPYFYAETDSDSVTIQAPTESIPGHAEISSASYDSEKMIVLFTQYFGYEGETAYQCKAILEKDETGKFKLVRIENTIS